MSTPSQPSRVSSAPTAAPSSREERPLSAPYLVFTLVLSLLALLALLIQRTASLSPDERVLLEWFDFAVCGVFFADFVYNLARSRERWRYLRTWGWLDLLSSIPVAGAFRIVRLLRALRAARVLAQALTLRRAGSSLVTASLFGVVVLILASVAILQVEQGEGTSIHTAEDALWWSITTMTTVGYGDLYPVTTEGRLVGAGLMIVGVGLVGVLTAFLASLFVKADETATLRELSELRREVGELKEMLRGR
jgi:voltage-gated potassium channel